MTSVIDRRTFLAGTGAVLLAAPLAAEAQPAGKVWRIGYLSAGPPMEPRYRRAFEEGGSATSATFRVNKSHSNTALQKAIPHVCASSPLSWFDCPSISLSRKRTSQ
jgi:hypothetical protein